MRYFRFSFTSAGSSHYFQYPFTEKVMVKMIWQNKMAYIENVVLDDIVEILRFQAQSLHIFLQTS